jgi:poly(3-hydroxyalkanoate) synthetase
MFMVTNVDQYGEVATSEGETLIEAYEKFQADMLESTGYLERMDNLRFWESVDVAIEPIKITKVFSEF